MKFVNIQLAIKLKEKGFREKVNAYYGKYENIFDVHPALDMNDCDYRASAPTISQVLKWLREEKDICVWAKPYYTYATNNSIGWDWNVSEIDEDAKALSYHTSNGMFAKYEDACIAGIEYVLDNLI